MWCRGQCEWVVLTTALCKAGYAHPLARLVLKTSGPLELQVDHICNAKARHSALGAGSRVLKMEAF